MAKLQVILPMRQLLLNFDFDFFSSELTDGYSGADMANLCKEAAMGPIRSLDYSQMEAIRPEDVRSINFDDFQMALKQVKASVSNKDLQMYHDWNSQYGSTGK
jgi:SpoVK/Ycf46/Vps4 family AAA+-type ATPase